MDLHDIHSVLNPLAYFDTRDQRMSLKTFGQCFKDIHDILGHQLTNIELIQRTPYLLTNLLKKGTRLNADSLKRSLTGYIQRMSASGEFNHVSEDLAHLILNLQRGLDNAKLIASGKQLSYYNSFPIDLFRVSDQLVLHCWNHSNLLQADSGGEWSHWCKS